MFRLITKSILLFLILMSVVLLGYKQYHMYRPVPLILTVSPDKVIDITGDITKSSMDIANAKLIKIVKAGGDEVVLKINSGGGEVAAGMSFVNLLTAAQSQKVKVICVVDGIAMSMALIIFSECNTRYATFSSKVMWHSIALSGCRTFNEGAVSELLEYMQIKNEEVWANTRIHFYPWIFKEHFTNETQLDVSWVEQTGFNYLRVINNIIIKKPIIKKKEETKNEEVKKSK